MVLRRPGSPPLRAGSSTTRGERTSVWFSPPPQISRLALEYHSCNRSRKAYGDQGGPPTEAPPASGLRPPLTAPQAASRAPCCHSVVLPPQWHALPRTHNVCELCVNQTAGVQPSRLGGPPCSFLEMEAALDSFYLQEQPFLRVASRSAPLCSHFLGAYSPFRLYSACCRTMGLTRPGGSPALPSGGAFAPRGEGWPGEPPERSLPHAEDRRGLPSGQPPLHGSAVAGLSCRTNRTLSLYLLDSNLFWLFAERLGAPSALPVREFAAIVDLQEEAHYVLGRSQALHRSSLGKPRPLPDRCWDWREGGSGRPREPDPDPSVAPETFIQNYSAPYSPLQRHLVGGEGAGRPQAQRLVREVTTDTFREMVLWTEKVTLAQGWATTRAGASRVA